MTAHKDFMPVIVGTDINAYYVARCFHEEYGIKPTLLGKEPMGFTSYSNITHMVYDARIWEADALIERLILMAEELKHSYKQLILIGTNDFYVRLIIENRERLEPYYLFNKLSLEMLNKIIVKDEFYQLCETYGLDIPKTIIYDCGFGVNQEYPTITEFPVILKPGNGDVYYRNKFEGQHKVYRLESNEAVRETIDLVKASGYDQKLIIQEYIPGDDTLMYDSVFYSNQQGKVEFISFARVLLQEHAITAIGNYTALITRYNEDLMLKLKNFVEAIGYVGFGNFDIKYDIRDGKYKLFEVNIRQGRSSYYVTACGYNLMKYLVDDLIYHKNKEFLLLDKPMVFSVVPMSIVKKYIKEEELRQEVRSYIRKRYFTNPLIYRKDRNVKRFFYNIIRGFNYHRKYKNNKW